MKAILREKKTRTRRPEGKTEPERFTFPFDLRHARVVELGAGVGLWLAAASAGAHVMLTDLPAVVDDVLLRNIDENRARGGVVVRNTVGAGDETSSRSEESRRVLATNANDRAWLGGVPIVGGVKNGSDFGTASAQPLDWTRDIDAQLIERRARSESAKRRLIAEEEEERRKEGNETDAEDSTEGRWPKRRHGGLLGSPRRARG